MNELPVNPDGPFTLAIHDTFWGHVKFLWQYLKYIVPLFNKETIIITCKWGKWCWGERPHV